MSTLLLRNCYLVSSCKHVSSIRVVQCSLAALYHVLELLSKAKPTNNAKTMATYDSPVHFIHLRIRCYAKRIAILNSAASAEAHIRKKALSYKPIRLLTPNGSSLHMCGRKKLMQPKYLGGFGGNCKVFVMYGSTAPNALSLILQRLGGRPTLVLAK